MPFSSKDFSSTRPTLQTQMPERLVHRAVREQRDGHFSSERGHGVAVVDLPSHTLSLTIGHLAGGQSTRKHRHNYETVLYVVKGTGYTLIENEKIAWTAGDAVYVPVWAWHQHVNSTDDDAEYVACENAPMLQTLGNIALREEAPTDSAKTKGADR